MYIIFLFFISNFHTYQNKNNLSFANVVKIQQIQFNYILNSNRSMQSNLFLNISSPLVLVNSYLSEMNLTFTDKTEQQVTRLSGKIEELTLENNKLKTQVEILKDPISPSMRGNNFFF